LVAARDSFFTQRLFPHCIFCEIDDYRRCFPSRSALVPPLFLNIERRDVVLPGGDLFPFPGSDSLPKEDPPPPLLEFFDFSPFSP